MARGIQNQHTDGGSAGSDSSWIAVVCRFIYIHAPIKEMRKRLWRWEERWWTASSQSVRGWLVTVLLTSGSLTGKGNQSTINPIIPVREADGGGRPPTSATIGLASSRARQGH